MRKCRKGVPFQIFTGGHASEGLVTATIVQMDVAVMPHVDVICGEQTADVNEWVYSQSLENKASTKALRMYFVSS